MSTRAVVAVPYGDSWHGRHAHTDGYPSWDGHELWTLVKRDGLKIVRKVLTEDYYAWDIIRNDQPDITGVTPAEDRWGPWRDGYTAEYVALLFNPASENRGQYAGGRFTNVPGYGIAWTPGVDIPADEWRGPQDGTWDAEWAYVLADNGLWVFECHFSLGAQSEPTFLGIAPWEKPEPNWEAVQEAAYDGKQSSELLQIGAGV